jgi:uncharacterized protein (DUF1786 family)
MGRYLMVDIGAGTMDVLCYDDQGDQHYKAVVRSPVKTVAEYAAGLKGPLVVTGGEMGGGPVTEVLRNHARTAEVVMSASAAATLHHNPQRVREWGIRIVEDAEAERLQAGTGGSALRLEDLQIERLEKIVTACGIPFAFDLLAVCAQDHGMPPPGVSHLDYRHQLACRVLDRDPSPHALLYRADEIPPSFNRLRTIARSAAAFPAAEVYVMDSGMAAVLGAAMDLEARGRSPILVLDIATSHTVGAVLEAERLAAYFEYHTREISLERLERLLGDLADGRLRHSRILAEGGHGAYLRHVVGFDRIECILATGPKRGILAGTRLPVTFGAPWGDNMMTGTVGLLEAVRRRKGLEPIPYF